MGRVQRERYIEKISSMLLLVYRKYEKDSAEWKEAQNQILTAYRAELQSIGLSRTSIQDYLKCGLVRALDQHRREAGSK